MQKSIFDNPLQFFDKDLIDHRKRKYALGIFFLFLISAIWIASSVLSQYLYTECEFDSPFLVTYIGVCLFAFILPMKYVSDKIGLTRDTTCMDIHCMETVLPTDDISIATAYLEIKEQHRMEKREQKRQEKSKSNKLKRKGGKSLVDDKKSVGLIDRTNSTSYNNENDDNNKNNNDASSVSSVFTSTTLLDLNHPGPHWNHSKHFFVALHIAPVLFIANWLFSASLQSTSVVSATVLVSTSCLFVFVLAVLVKEEKFHICKLIGVLLGIFGSALTARHDFIVKDDYDAYTPYDDTIEDDYYSLPYTKQSSNSNNGDTGENYYYCTTADCDYNLWGDTLAVLAAVGFGAYLVQVRLLCPLDEELYSMGLLLGYIGLVVMIPLLPLAIVLMTKIRMTWEVFGLIVVRGLFDYCLSEYLHFRAVVLTNATIASVGLGLTIPMAFFADYLMKKDNIASVSSLLGAVAVTAGFLLVNIFDEQDDETSETTDERAIGGENSKNNDDKTSYKNRYANGIPKIIGHDPSNKQSSTTEYTSSVLI